MSKPLIYRRPLSAATNELLSLLTTSFYHHSRSYSNLTSNDHSPGYRETKNEGKWYTLPPFTNTVNGSALGKQISKGQDAKSSYEKVDATALKWVLKCCPQLPRSLVQKLFRLRQVRRETSCMDAQAQNNQLKRVAAKDSMNLGDRIFLPITVKDFSSTKEDVCCSGEVLEFVCGLEIYKDSAIIAVNKPPGLPVQGGMGVRWSLDELAATCLKYDYPDPPRLVHRIDRDCSGILVMGRTQTSAALMHSLFREKTIGALKEDIGSTKRILQRTYLAVVLGSPRRSEGLISAPLGKVVMDSGKSDRIMVMNRLTGVSTRHAITEFRVVDSFHGYTLLELSPLTGRKHQLRVHCAEILGTPILGDYKYGWQVHKKWKHLPLSCSDEDSTRNLEEKPLSFGLDMGSGSIADKEPRLHLHCKQICLPSVALALQEAECSTYDLSKLESLELVAPLPLFMQRSIDIMKNR